MASDICVWATRLTPCDSVGRTLTSHDIQHVLWAKGTEKDNHGLPMQTLRATTGYDELTSTFYYNLFAVFDAILSSYVPDTMSFNHQQYYAAWYGDQRRLRHQLAAIGARLSLYHPMQADVTVGNEVDLQLMYCLDAVLADDGSEFSSGRRMPMVSTSPEGLLFSHMSVNLGYVAHCARRKGIPFVDAKGHPLDLSSFAIGYFSQCGRVLMQCLTNVQIGRDSPLHFYTATLSADGHVLHACNVVSTESISLAPYPDTFTTTKLVDDNMPPLHVDHEELNAHQLRRRSYELEKLFNCSQSSVFSFSDSTGAEIRLSESGVLELTPLGDSVVRGASKIIVNIDMTSAFAVPVPTLFGGLMTYKICFSPNRTLKEMSARGVGNRDLLAAVPTETGYAWTSLPPDAGVDRYTIVVHSAFAEMAALMASILAQIVRSPNSSQYRHHDGGTVDSERALHMLYEFIETCLREYALGKAAHLARAYDIICDVASLVFSYVRFMVTGEIITGLAQTDSIRLLARSKDLTTVDIILATAGTATYAMSVSSDSSDERIDALQKCRDAYALVNQSRQTEKAVSTVNVMKDMVNGWRECILAFESTYLNTDNEYGPGFLSHDPPSPTCVSLLLSESRVKDVFRSRISESVALSFFDCPTLALLPGYYAVMDFLVRRYSTLDFVTPSYVRGCFERSILFVVGQFEELLTPSQRAIRIQELCLKGDRALLAYTCCASWYIAVDLISVYLAQQRVSFEASHGVILDKVVYTSPTGNYNHLRAYAIEYRDLIRALHQDLQSWATLGALCNIRNLDFCAGDHPSIIRQIAATATGDFNELPCA